jgi:hypothetical protein
MPPRNPAQMTPEERAAKVGALKPEWARTYIRQLEGITRHLAAQLAAAQAQGAGDPALAAQVAAPFYAQFGAWARTTAPVPPGIPDARKAFPGIPDPILAACFRQLSQDTPGLLLADNALPGPAPGWIPPGQAGNPESAAWLAGITPPSGEYATIRVLDGRAGMEPVADLAEGAEIRFADFYQVHYGNHETTGGTRVLIVETDDSLVIRPVNQNTVIIARG